MVGRVDDTGGAGTGPSLWSMLGQVLYIGTIGYGGPTALTYLRAIFVNDRRWFSEGEFLEAMSLAQILPGSTGVTAVSYFGYRRFGYFGAVVFPLAFLAPSIGAILVLSWAYFTYGQLSLVQPLFAGLGALVVALLLNATLSLGTAVFTGRRSRILLGLLIAAVTFTGSLAFRINLIWLVLLSGVLGIALFWRSSGVDLGTPGADEVGAAPAASDRPHSLKRFLPLVVTGVLVLAALAVPETRTLFVSFFQVGLLAFGGGFASVALLQHVVVDQMGWLPFLQFRDGIALGQVTPGPVLITAGFVGYKVFGVLGLLAATFGIFLPPALLIVLVADLHDRFKRNRVVQAVVRGFQCGFIGLVAAITIQFGIGSLVDWQTWLIFVASFVLVWWFKRSAAWAILGTVAFALLFIR
ncbi:MAG: chromate efflux transporter [Propionibacteriaceae bacterium]|nr:chromate efflux transporter [Propionibacteriaceae bacterium]